MRVTDQSTMLFVCIMILAAWIVALTIGHHQQSLQIQSLQTIVDFDTRRIESLRQETDGQHETIRSLVEHELLK